MCEYQIIFKTLKLFSHISNQILNHTRHIYVLGSHGIK